MTRYIKKIKKQRIVLEPLTKTEIDKAYKIIEQEHPLKHTLIWETLPCLKYCKKSLPKFVPNQQDDSELDEETKENLSVYQGANDLEKLIGEDDEEDIDDPPPWM